MTEMREHVLLRSLLPKVCRSLPMALFETALTPHLPLSVTRDEDYCFQNKFTCPSRHPAKSDQRCISIQRTMLRSYSKEMQ